MTKAIRSILLSLSLFLSFALPAAAGVAFTNGKTYAGVILNSAHIDPSAKSAENLNNKTFGLTIGRRWSVGPRDQEVSIEGGYFYNSYRESGPLVILGWSARVFQLTPKDQIRAGLFTGLGYYPTLAKNLKTEYGIPNFNDMIPMAGLSASWRHGPSELRLTAVPPKNLKAILNLSWTYAF